MSTQLIDTRTTNFVAQLQTWVVGSRIKFGQLLSPRKATPLAIATQSALNISIQQYGKTNPITIFKLQGKLNNQSYQDLATQAVSIYEQGSRRLLINLDEASEIKLSGAFALRNIARLFAGQRLVDPAAGYDALRQISRSQHTNELPVKLLASTDKIQTMLTQALLDQQLPVYNDMAEALKAFA